MKKVNGAKGSPVNLAKLEKMLHNVAAAGMVIGKENYNSA